MKCYIVEVMKITKGNSILIIGQHLTSRTEAIRDFLLPRINRLAVIALSSAFINKNENHIFLYERGVLKKHLVFYHRLFKKTKSYKLLVLSTFILYCWDIFRALIILGMRFDLFIGISHFPGLTGILLKFVGFCHKNIYYAIDYYAYPVKNNKFEIGLLKTEKIFDKLAVSYSDEVWDLSPKISEARLEFSGIRKESYDYKSKIAPLGYSKNFFRNKSIKEIDRFALVFVGVIIEGQGLELILEALPTMVKAIPGIHVKVVGTGPFLTIFKSMVVEKNMENLFRFYGFVEDESELLDIVSSSAIGISCWDYSVKTSFNSYFSDPGKTKLYSVCGLPVIVSKDTAYSKIVENNKAGIAINYKQEEFINAVSAILSEDKIYGEFKANAVKTALNYCDSEKIFSNILN